MGLVNSLRKTLYRARAIAAGLDPEFRPHRVELVRRHWDDGATGDGDDFETTLRLVEANSQNPKVRWLDEKIVALADMPKGTVEIGPLTPEFQGGGTNLAELQGLNLERGDERYVRITGPQHPNGALYRIIKVTCDRPLRHVIHAEPVATA